MKLRIFASILLTVFALSMSVVTSADGITKRVRFARGKSSATVSGAVVRGDRDTYIVGAGTGQTMRVSITSPENNAVFQVMDDDGNYLSGADEGDDATNWSGKLPWKGDYKIIVGGTRGNAGYRMTISIQ
jgi:flagellar hook assembly protein FlgD